MASKRKAQRDTTLMALKAEEEVMSQGIGGGFWEIEKSRKWSFSRASRKNNKR